MAESPPPGNVFNAYGWGGYAIYRLWPGRRAYIYGDAAVMGDAFLSEYEAVELLHSNYDDVLSARDVSWILDRTDAPLVSVLRRSPDWVVLHSDSLATVLVHRAPGTSAFISGPTGSNAAPETRRDRRFVRRWTIVALALLSFPYIALWLLTPSVTPGGQYTGMLFNPADTFLYVSQVLHSHLGEWAFTDYFTYIREPSLPLFAFYTLLGKLVFGPAGPASLDLAFQVARLLLALLFIQQAWRLYSEVLPGRASRRVALLFLLFTAGMGAYRFFLVWLPPPPGPDQFPFDLAYIESSSFFGLLYAPHFAAVLVLVVVYLRALFRVARTASWKATALGAASAAGLATIHPEKIGVIGITTVLFLGALQLQSPLGLRRWTQGFLMVVGGVPYTVFAFLLTLNDKQVVELLRQGRPHQPPPDPWFYYPLGYGFPGLFAGLGSPRLLRGLRRAPAGELLLWSMVAGSLVILLAPWQALDHRAEGLQLAVAGLAGRNLVHTVLPRFWRSRVFAASVRRRLFGYRRRRLRLLSLNVVIILSSLTVMALAFASWRTALRDAPAEIYLNRDDPAALSWLRAHAGRDDVVVAGPQSAQFVAAYGGTHVVWGNGHSPQLRCREPRAVGVLPGPRRPGRVPPGPLGRLALLRSARSPVHLPSDDAGGAPRRVPRRGYHDLPRRPLGPPRVAEATGRLHGAAAAAPPRRDGRGRGPALLLRQGGGPAHHPALPGPHL